MHPSIHAGTNPESTACIMAGSGETLTYGELDRHSNRLAHFLRQKGVSAGDTIAIVLPNQLELFPLVWAAQRSGVTFTCLSYRLSPEDLAYILQDCGARITFGSLATRDLLTKAAEAGFTGQIELIDAADFTERLAGLPETPIADEMAGADMLYSSGTTGRPKGVKQPFVADYPIDAPTPLALLAQRRFGMDGSTRYLSPAPLYHAGPLRWSMLIQRLGGTVVVMEKFDAEQALQFIEKYQITAAQWVPTHFTRMLQLPQAARSAYDLSSLTVALHAAAPCPVPVKQAMLEWWGPILHEYYGGTENNGLTLIGPQEWLKHPGSVGKAIVGKVHVCDVDGNELPAGETGDVFFSGGQAFEYHNDPEKTRGAYNEHGWSTLGDIGHLDSDGFLYLTDRKNFTIISGGVNIYPQEIENVLSAHPAISDVAVFGAPDADFGERVVAVVELAASEKPSDALAAEIQAYARERLGSIKSPKQVDFTFQLPREPTGKLFKKQIVAQYRAGHAQGQMNRQDSADAQSTAKGRTPSTEGNGL